MEQNDPYTRVALRTMGERELEGVSMGGDDLIFGLSVTS